jgi:hypothetical protein
MSEWTPEALAKAYVDTISGQANGWGQYVHPTLGISHAVLLRLHREAGKDKGDRLLQIEFDRWNKEHK